MQDLLDDVAAFVGRFVVLKPEQLDALTLWATHTHLYRTWRTTPYLAVQSPTLRAGKSTLFEVLRLLVARPWPVVDVTPAALFRKVDQDGPTLLLDEVDASSVSKHLRAVLNSGFMAGGYVPRVETFKGVKVVVEYSTFCPKAFAGIGASLPPTVMDRSIPIRVQRRAPHEHVERFSAPSVLEDGETLYRRLVAAAESNNKLLAEIEPVIVEGLDDRAQQAWESLLAIAQVAQGDWPKRAAEAAALLNGEKGEPDPAVRLIADIRIAFELALSDVLATSDLLSIMMNHIPEPAYEGELDPMRLAQVLRPLGVRPRSMRRPSKDGEPRVVRGYRRADFEPLWARYLPPTPATPATPVTS